MAQRFDRFCRGDPKVLVIADNGTCEHVHSPILDASRDRFTGQAVPVGYLRIWANLGGKPGADTDQRIWADNEHFTEVRAIGTSCSVKETDYSSVVPAMTTRSFG